MILEVKDGFFSYKGSDKPILNGVNFKISPGDITAVLGPNGAGKTTLLRCITGSLKWQSGQSLLDGKNIKTISQKSFWSFVSYVPQAKGTASALTVEELVLLGRSSKIGFLEKPSNLDVEIARKALDDLGIYDISKKPCCEISGGQLQMVLIARAMANDPKILIFDEPESNLDFKNQLTVLEAMSRLAREGKACIFNTHFPSHALTRANKSLLLDGSGTAIFGKTSEIVTEANIESAFKVKAVIGEFETEKTTHRDIIPIHVSEGGKRVKKQTDSVNRLAVMSVTFKDFSVADSVNKCLNRCGKYIVGRMGMPYKKYNVHIINISFDGPSAELKSLERELSIISGVNVKTIYEDVDL